MVEQGRERLWKRRHGSNILGSRSVGVPWYMFWVLTICYGFLHWLKLDWIENFIYPERDGNLSSISQHVMLWIKLDKNMITKFATAECTSNQSSTQFQLAHQALEEPFLFTFISRFCIFFAKGLIRDILSQLLLYYYFWVLENEIIFF